MLDEKVKVKLATDLCNKINIEYKNIKWYMKALDSTKISFDGQGKDNDSYQNESLATLGDAVIKKILTEYYFNKGYSKGQITKLKKKYEDNKFYTELTKGYDFNSYSFNQDYTFLNAPEHEKLPSFGHDVFVEAIVAAIYKDRGERYTKKWVMNFLKVK